MTASSTENITPSSTRSLAPTASAYRKMVRVTQMLKHAMPAPNSGSSGSQRTSSLQKFHGNELELAIIVEVLL